VSIEVLFLIYVFSVYEEFIEDAGIEAHICLRPSFTLT